MGFSRVLAASLPATAKRLPLMLPKGVNLREGFKADGGLSLQRAKIDGSLDCDAGQFIGKGETQAVFADSAKIEGWILFRGGFAAAGEVNFVAAYAARGFQWLDAKSIERVVLDLRYFKVGVLRNSQNSWPTQGHLFVGAFLWVQ